MTDFISKTFAWYCNYVADWWSHISYWEYIGVLVACLAAGWMMLRRPINGFS